MSSSVGPNYEYECDVLSIVDGDTLDVRIDVGFATDVRERVRLRRVDTREISFVSHDSEEYRRGMVHKEFVEDWVDDADRLVVRSEEYERGSYCRVLGDFYNGDEWLSDALLEEFDDVAEWE